MRSKKKYIDRLHPTMAAFSVSAGNGKPSRKFNLIVLESNIDRCRLCLLTESYRDTKDGINNAVQKAIGLYSASTPNLKRRKKKHLKVRRTQCRRFFFSLIFSWYKRKFQNIPNRTLQIFTYTLNIPEKLKFERLDKFLRPFPFLKDNINLQVFEFPLTNKNPGARGLGPARVILEEKNDV